MPRVIVLFFEREIEKQRETEREKQRLEKVASPEFLRWIHSPVEQTPFMTESPFAAIASGLGAKRRFVFFFELRNVCHF